jgi:hypothetical protein
MRKNKRIVCLNSSSFRYFVSIGWLFVMTVCFFFVFPKLHDTSLNIALALAGISCISSFTYTYLKSRSLPQRTRDELLCLLRDGTDPCLMCPDCNIVQSAAIHCTVCNTCVADPYAQHSFLLATCITSRNRKGFIFFATSLLLFDMILLLISVTNFQVEILPEISPG